MDSNHRPFPCQSCDIKFYNDLQTRGDCQTTRKSHKTSNAVGWVVGWPSPHLKTVPSLLGAHRVSVLCLGNFIGKTRDVVRQQILIYCTVRFTVVVCTVVPLVAEMVMAKVVAGGVLGEPPHPVMVMVAASVTSKQSNMQSFPRR